MPRPLVIVHGYSDKAKTFETWRGHLEGTIQDINLCNWVSLSNEITIRDISEGFDRALKHKGIAGEFDALVHSTGMLVVRSWLADDPSRRGRLKHLIGIAPATFGSPLAAQGRSVLGAIFKGSKELFSPDFLNAGDLILDGLELGSRFTWDLAHKDLLGDVPFYGLGNDTPYVFVFCGTAPYGGLRSLINQPGTDGTVRWSGVALNTEKVTIDFRRSGGGVKDDVRCRASNTPSRGGLPIPFWPVPGVNHGSIAEQPTPELVQAVKAALAIESAGDFEAWQEKHTQALADEHQRLMSSGQAWQQFVVHAVDQLGDPVNDFQIQFAGLDANGNEIREWTDDEMQMHIYSTDKSYRCYHLNISEILALEKLVAVKLEVIAMSGSAWVGYHGEGSETLPSAGGQVMDRGRWDAVVTLPTKLKDGPSIFFPFTTTLIELILERDALPFGNCISKLVDWWQQS